MDNFGFVRTIDRTVLIVLGIVLVTNGLYLSGPWYNIATPEGEGAPLFNLLSHSVVYFGVINFLIGLCLIVGTVWKRLWPWLHWMILGAFLARLYSLIGVLAISDFLPPAYTSHIATVIILGGYWLYFRYYA